MISCAKIPPYTSPAKAARSGSEQFAEEFAAFEIASATRSKRMEESIEVMRLVSYEENASYSGEFNQFEKLTIESQPIQQSILIWVTANPSPDSPKLHASAPKFVTHLGGDWTTTANKVESLRANFDDIKRYADEAGRELTDDIEVCPHYNIRAGSDCEQTVQKSSEYLQAYCGVEYPCDSLERWLTMVDAQRCIDEIGKFVDADATTITLRLVGHDESQQLERVTIDMSSAFS
ncbi:MAG: LLM class flavin-dependent oxidoreductase [Gammaproteobacteria bacterium]